LEELLVFDGFYEKAFFGGDRTGGQNGIVRLEAV
jgi:hypothetical protein